MAEIKEKLYNVLNLTDGIYANHESLTSEQADTFIKEFPLRYKQQGYYFTSNRERIPPEDVKLQKVEEDDDDMTWLDKF